MTLGATADGSLTAVRHEGINTTSISDTQFEAVGMASRGAYASPNIELDHQVERIHSVRTSPMRAPVEGPGSWALESAMDELALKLRHRPARPAARQLCRDRADGGQALVVEEAARVLCRGGRSLWLARRGTSGRARTATS